ncbi:YbgA family protein [Methyloglobulus sp.]|uniref:YbgA family protein n=1 Tax=Methyloglobulus sp. TaxID=2518622 RepID=UPI003989A0C7
MKKIPVGISSCLLGQAVRYDGGLKLDSYIVGTLAEYFDFKPFCPEVAIGIGTPRPTIQLVKIDNEIRSLGVKNPDFDVTAPLRDYANRQKAAHDGLCGYILKKDSPSCGMERVKVYINNQPQKMGTGIYAEAMIRNNPLLPVEEEGRLGDPRLRENFIQRVYVLYRWKRLLAEGLTPSRLTRFHARHKLIIMSHENYIDLGQLLASVTKSNVNDVANSYITQLMSTLKKVASRKSHVNVLQHIQGYLKKELSVDDKAELCELIERYRHGEVPLIVPINLLKHHFRKNPDPYIEDSHYMSPYPQELQLINER